jgi:predicted amidohydrolase
MKVAAIQHEICWEDAELTRKRVEPLIARAADAQAKLIVLTEMFNTGFSMRRDRIAEPEGGPSEQFLVEQAGTHDAYVVASIAQYGGDGVHRNNAIVACPDGAVHRYAKIHPFTYSGEHEHYSPGDRFLTVPLADGAEQLRASVFVCYDLRFADEFWGLAPSTDVYLVVANWPEARREHWRVLLRARAIENQAYVVGVNRVGTGGALTYTGDSAIIDPLGRAIAEPRPGEEDVAIADVEASVVRRVRGELPFLADRRAASSGV